MMEILLFLLEMMMISLSSLCKRISSFLGDAYWSIRSEMPWYVQFTFKWFNNKKICSEYTYIHIHTNWEIKQIWQKVNNCWIKVETIQIFLVLFFQFFYMFENLRNEKVENADSWAYNKPSESDSLDVEPRTHRLWAPEVSFRHTIWKLLNYGAKCQWRNKSNRYVIKRATYLGRKKSAQLNTSISSGQNMQFH